VNSGELGALAAALLRDIADGKAIEPARLHQLADAVLASNLVRAAQADANEMLIRQGNTDTEIHFVLTGRFSIRANGRHVAERSAGEHVGEMDAIDVAARRSADVVALETKGLRSFSGWYPRAKQQLEADENRGKSVR
jgi:CRP-like cAMP-binding protein